MFCLPSFALLAIAAILTLPSLRRIKPEPDRLCLWSSAAFFGYVLTRALFSTAPYLARSDIYPVLGGLLLYLLVACIFTSARTRMLLLLFLIVLAMAQTFVGAFQFRDGNNYMPIAWLQRVDYGRRASGFYICPNHLAGLLEVLGIFALSIVCWSRWPVWAKLLTSYGAGICYLGVVLTGSRGGYLSTITSMLVFALLSVIILARAGSGLVWKVGGGAAIAAFAIALALLFTFQRSHYLAERAQNTFEVQNMRVDMWRSGMQQWKLNPIFGTGSGTFLYYGRQFRSERVQVDPFMRITTTLTCFAIRGDRRDWLSLFSRRSPESRRPDLHSRGREARRPSASPFQQLTCAQHRRTRRRSGLHCSFVFDFNLHIPPMCCCSLSSSEF